MKSLKDKTVCVTGASSGMGEACAIECAKGGAKLLLIARRKEKLEILRESLLQYTSNIHIEACDVRDKNLVSQLPTVIPELYQDVDVLINSAGLALGTDTLDKGNADDWDTMIDTNVKGVFYFIRAFLPSMLNRNSGQIVNIGSVSCHLTYPGGAGYCASKYALLAINNTLREEVLGKNIRVNLISPGIVDTDFLNVRFNGDQEKIKTASQGLIPLSAKDIADAVIYCLMAPAHVNLDEIIITPIQQAGRQIFRTKE